MREKLFISLFFYLSLFVSISLFLSLSISPPILISVILAHTRALSLPRDQSLLISLTHLCARVRGRRGDSSLSLLPPLSPSSLARVMNFFPHPSLFSIIFSLLLLQFFLLSVLLLFLLHLAFPLLYILYLFSFSPFAMNFSSTLRKIFLMHA